MPSAEFFIDSGGREGRRGVLAYEGANSASQFSNDLGPIGACEALNFLIAKQKTS